MPTASADTKKHVKTLQVEKSGADLDWKGCHLLDRLLARAARIRDPIQ
ncbi:MAG: hypothetical protein ACRD45_16795 [Bryobacteraceae bacterium]